MPIYAYRCEGCGFQKDALQKLSDPPLVDCPECGAPRFVKQLTAAGFALKGTGWYVTDFRDGSKKSSQAQASSDAASAASTATTGAAAPSSDAATPAAPAPAPATSTASGSA
jgi:putative FmdB family regulatory protein